MALVLLDGTTAAVDLTIAPTSAGTEVSVKCIATDITLAYQRATFSKTTFCSSNWEIPIPALRRGIGHVGAFVSTGAAYSTPLVWFASDLALPFTFTADTGNTVAHKLVETQESMGVRAQGDFGRGIDFVTSGVPTVVWVIT